MSCLKKFAIISAVVVVAIMIQYLMLTPEEFKEFWGTIIGLIVIVVALKEIGNFSKVPSDRSRNTIDWEMEQERREKEEEEENAMKTHGGNK